MDVLHNRSSRLEMVMYLLFVVAANGGLRVLPCWQCSWCSDSLIDHPSIRPSNGIWLEMAVKLSVAT